MGLLDGLPYDFTREFIRFSICSTKVETLPFCAVSTASDLESEDSTTVLLNFGGILQQKSGLIRRCFTKMCHMGCAKNMFGGFSNGIH